MSYKPPKPSLFVGGHSNGQVIDLYDHHQNYVEIPYIKPHPVYGKEPEFIRYFVETYTRRSIIVKDSMIDMFVIHDMSDEDALMEIFSSHTKMHDKDRK